MRALVGRDEQISVFGHYDKKKAAAAVRFVVRRSSYPQQTSYKMLHQQSKDSLDLRALEVCT